MTWMAFIVDPQRTRNAVGRQAGPADVLFCQGAVVESVASGIETLPTAAQLILTVFTIGEGTILILLHTYWRNLPWVKGGLVWLLVQAAPLCGEELVQLLRVTPTLRRIWLRGAHHEVRLDVNDGAATIKGHFSGRMSADGCFLCTYKRDSIIGYLRVQYIIVLFEVHDICRNKLTLLERGRDQHHQQHQRRKSGSHTHCSEILKDEKNNGNEGETSLVPGQCGRHAAGFEAACLRL